MSNRSFLWRLIAGISAALEKRHPEAARTPYFFTKLTLAIALATTALAVWLSYSVERSRAHRAVAREAELIAETLNNVMTTYEQVLRASAGLVRSSGVPTLRSWRLFTESLELDTRFPGIQGLGYVEVFDRSRIAARVAQERRDGRPGFTWRPDGERDLYTAIIYLEPDDPRNQRAIGFDMYSEPTRRQAMQRARDTAEPVLSNLVTLVQETSQDMQPGGLSYLALYEGGGKPTTVAERQARLRGFVYGVFRWGDFVSRSLAKHLPAVLDRVHLQVYAHAEADETKLLFDSLADSNPPPKSRYVHTHDADVGGRAWSVRVTARPAFEDAIDWSKPLLVLFSGLALTLLLGAISASLAHSRERALAAKDELAREVQQRRHAQEQVQLANGELIHRVKNTLAIVSAIASQTARHSTSLPEFTSAFRERLAALGAVHDLLRPDPAYTPDLRDFLRDILKAFGRSGTGTPALSVEGPPVALPRNEAVLLSLFVNELATNATKYGAWSVPTGSVAISWTLETSDTGDEVVLTWKETGGPKPQAATRAGFGTHVIQSIERGMRGRIQRSYEEDGIKVSFRFPQPTTTRHGASR